MDADADYELIEESLLLLPGVGDGIGENVRGERGEETNVVRVAINPSVLDRCLHCGRGRYYFYDDIAVPYARLLDGAERPLLPSQKARLAILRSDGAAEDCGEGEVFGCLWMRLCARLAEAKAGFFRRERRRLCLVGIVWHALISILVLALLEESASEAWSVVTFSMLAVLNMCPMAVRLSPITKGKVQGIVDEMAPLFEEEGFHVDLVTSSPMYIRFERAGSLDAGVFPSSMSLSESMSQFQERARRDHQDAGIDQRQARLRANGLGPVWILGVPLETLEEWKPTLVRLTVVLGSFFVMLSIMLFMGHGTLSSLAVARIR